MTAATDARSPQGSQDFACDYCGDWLLTLDELDAQLRRATVALCSKCRRSPGRRRVMAKVRRTAWQGGDGPIRDFTSDGARLEG